MIGDSMTNPQLHVIFGAGQVGRPLAELLLAAGHRVRIVKRAPLRSPTGAEVLTGDAGDAAFCAAAARDAAVVYHCINPPYFADVWAEQVPRYLENLIAAAGPAGARLVVLDNLYALGRPSGRSLDEERPLNPCSRKGEVRARAIERLFSAQRRGDVRATAGWASDFYGPGGTQSHVGDQFWPGVMAGKRGRVVIRPDAVHTYHYIPDVAAGLMALGTAGDDVEGRPWMLPCAPAGTLRELIGRFAAHLARPIRLAALSPLSLRAMGLFVPILRELAEMSYQWEEPFVVDDRRFRERFPVRPADPDEAARATVAWASAHYRRE
jgi:nucleoside-diphosphate-sugar epimerase